MRFISTDSPERPKSGLDLLLKHPIKSGILAFIFVYSVAVLYVGNISYRDPGSIFFRPESGYELHYTNDRLQQAEDFLSLASDNSSLSRGPENPADAQICLGFTSVARKDARYLRTAVASLLEGLREHERRSVYLIVLIAHSDPHEHPAYGEPWLENLADKVQLYELSDAEMEHVKDMENRQNGGHEKRLYDYMYIMKACRDSGTPYVALFEDDILAMDGWLHRTQAAIKDANKKSVEIKGKYDDFYFLRLFYTTEYMGWNSEDWPRHTFWSLAFIIYILGSVTWIRSRSDFLKRHTTLRTTLILSIIFVPLLILLFFAGGRMTMAPPQQGVHYLKYTCCSQAFVFPRQKTVDMVDWFEEKPGRAGDVDIVIAHYGERNHELKLALTPCVVQHIGRVSSKGSTGNKIFNFAFELNNVEQLREEHAAIAD